MKTIMKIAVMVVFLATVMVTRDGPWRTDQLRPKPGFSSPQEMMAPNGDRVSHYPPYYHPTQ